MRRTLSAVAFVGLIVGGCGESTPVGYDRFRESFDSGAGCEELFEAKNEVQLKGAEAQQVADDLRSVGCFTAESTRGEAGRVFHTVIPLGDDDEFDEPIGGEANLYSEWYRTTYSGCKDDAEGTYKESGTRDPEQAAAWRAEIAKEGEPRRGAHDGCLDALLGKASRVPEE